MSRQASKRPTPKQESLKQEALKQEAPKQETAKRQAARSAAADRERQGPLAPEEEHDPTAVPEEYYQAFVGIPVAHLAREILAQRARAARRTTLSPDSSR